MGKQPFDNFEVKELPDDLHHYRNAFDARFLRFTNLEGKPRVCTITHVGWLKSSNKSESKRQLLVTLQEFEKPWAINITNSETIGMLHGEDPHGWPGKRVTLYPTKTKFGRDVVDCIRVRDTVPEDPNPAAQKPAQQPAPAQAKTPMSEAARRHMQNMADASQMAHLDVVEEELTEDNSLSPEETALLVKALTKRRGQLDANP